MTKTLCKKDKIKWRKDAKYQCGKCGDISKKKKHLCKPEKISKKQKESL